VSVTPNVEISTELCEFVGAIIGDGNLWTDGSRYRVELTGDPDLDRTYYDYLSTLSQSLFTKKPYPIRVHQRGLRWRLQSKEAFKTLINLGLPIGAGKARHVIIPKLILQKKWDFVKWTIRGLMDTDGTLFFSKKTYKFPIYPTIELRTCSNFLANQIGTILQQNEFRAKVRGNQKEGFHVALYGFEMLNRWINEIGFSNNRHANKILAQKRFI
jgi:hypothetical protein